MTVVSQRVLLEQAKVDETQLGALLRSYTGYLTLIARAQVGRRLQGKADPDDLVQETFLEASRQFAMFRGTTEAEFTAWLRRILAGRVALLIRKFLGTKGRDVDLERDLVQQVDDSSQQMGAALDGSYTTPSQHASRREQAVLLAEAMDKLPGDYREVIALRHIEQLPFAEVAVRMNRSEDSVQKLWVRALKSLRQSLGSLA